MNVLVIGKFTLEQFGFHISYTLREMGHKVIEFNPLSRDKYARTLIGRRINQIREKVFNSIMILHYMQDYRIKRLKKILNENKIDLTICTHDFLLPDEVETIKKESKSPIVLWFPDPIGYSVRSFFMISNYDKLFFQDPYIVKILSNQYNMKNIVYLPEACNPAFHKHTQLTNKDIEKYSCDISTYGSPHNMRSQLFSQLQEYGYVTKIWGHQPPIWLKNEKIKSLYKGEYVEFETKAKSVLASKINLNTLIPGGIYGVNARTFEIAGIGGFQLIHWRLGLNQLFEDGKELVSFNNFDELLEKIKYYLQNDSERERIAFAGQKRAYNNHTYKHRLSLMISTLFGNDNGFQLPIANSKVS